MAGLHLSGKTATSSVVNVMSRKDTFIHVAMYSQDSYEQLGVPEN
jgi:hypothetical protein